MSEGSVAEWVGGWEGEWVLWGSEGGSVLCVQQSCVWALFLQVVSAL